MPRLTFFDLPNDSGQDLLDKWVKPVCRRHGVELVVAGPDENRATAMLRQATSRFVLWDCSVEGPRRVYHALNMWAKCKRNNLFVSRTPLPRNVLTYHQCAPIHGNAFSNAQLGEWLDRHLFTALRGDTGGRDVRPDDLGNYGQYDKGADYFLSFRGSYQREAERWRDRFQLDRKLAVRMVPPNEFSYPTEVVTQQQMWEGVSRLRYEMQAAARLIVLSTDDYFDSFWTCSELLLGLWLHGWDGWVAKPVAFRGGRPGWRRLASVDFAESLEGTGLVPLQDGMRALSIPGPGPQLTVRLALLINNGDPLTSAPETQVPPSGPAKLVARFARKFGFYHPEFMTDDFWNRVRVPCPRCKPHHRRPQDVDWGLHMLLPDSSPAVDYYGYFPATWEELDRGAVRCPGCGSELRLVNRRGVRTIWVPIMTTEADQDRPIIQEHKVWEVDTS
ncbi:hypothetical protein [Microbispora bryophytorum]|uniref:hypothetical protein n=1 Tax=Microbispora bryophytorum TaxID=1460882 RepID=UPI00340F31FC